MRLNITHPAVSQHISALEQHYGVKLVVQGRNGVPLTEAGSIATTYAEQMLSQLAQMNDAMLALQHTAEGPLSIGCPLMIAQTILMPVVADLRRTHPKLKVDLKASVHPSNPADSPHDLDIRACRIGPAEGSIRKLAEIEQVLVASPAYLDRLGHPTHIGDLARLDYVQYNDDPEEKFLPLASGEQAPITVVFAAQMPDLILHAVQNHMGMASVPRFYVVSELHAGSVEEVLPSHPIATKQLFLARVPGTLGKSRRVAICTDRFVKEVGVTPGLCLAAGLRASGVTHSHHG